MQEQPEESDNPFSTSTHHSEGEQKFDKAPDGHLMRLGKGCLSYFVEHIAILLVLGGAIGLGGSFVFDTIGRMNLNSVGSMALAVLLVFAWLAVVAIVIKFVGSWGQILLDKLKGKQ